jgi:uncharacterized membrane-anchored protein
MECSARGGVVKSVIKSIGQLALIWLAIIAVVICGALVMEFEPALSPVINHIGGFA